MPEPWTRRRLGWPGLAVLVLALAGALVWLFVTEESAAPDTIPRGPYVGALPDVLPAEPSRDAGPAAQLAFDFGPRPADPTGRDAVYDPQRSRSEARYPTSGDAGASGPPFAAVVHAGRVETSAGGPEVGTVCEVRVLPVDRAPFNCVVRVLCAGEVLYPNESQSTGYLVCEIEQGAVRRASDRDEGDGDPQIELDLEARHADVEASGRQVTVGW